MKAYFTVKGAAEILDMKENTIRVYLKRWGVKKQFGVRDWLLDVSVIDRLQHRNRTVGRPALV